MHRFILSSLAVAFIAAVFIVASPTVASAFCQTHTCEFDGRQVCTIDPVTNCASGGEVARWGSDCISYAVQVDGSSDENISANTLRQVLAAGFRAWSDAECEGPGASPHLTATSRGETACDQVEYACGNEGNDNIVMFRDDRSDLSANTIALSTIIANLRTGEILDVDIEINSQDFDFYADPADAEPGAHDLRVVLNHELGHMLGLSHSTDPQALMRAEYEGSSPLPARDDVRGMCSVFDASNTDPVCSVGTVEGDGVCVGSDDACPATVGSKQSGCALPVAALPVAGGAHGSGTWALAGLALVILSRRRPPGSARRMAGIWSSHG